LRTSDAPTSRPGSFERVFMAIPQEHRRSPGPGGFREPRRAMAVRCVWAPAVSVTAHAVSLRNGDQRPAATCGSAQEPFTLRSLCSAERSETADAMARLLRLYTSAARLLPACEPHATHRQVAATGRRESW
jgi:hypothetical protein